jgi:hypothetical protein
MASLPSPHQSAFALSLLWHHPVLPHPPLCLLLQEVCRPHLILPACSMLHLRHQHVVKGDPLARKNNTEADSLSLFELCPSWESIMASSSAQTNLRPCLLLPGLLSLLASAFPKNRSRHVGLRGAYLDHVASVPCTSNSLLPMANTLNHRLQSAISSIAQCAPAVSMYTSAAGGPPNLAAPIPSSLAGSMTEVANTTGEARAFHHCHDTDARAMGFRSHRVGEYAPSKGHRDAISRVPNTHSDLPELGKPIAFVAMLRRDVFLVCSLHISLHCYRAAPYFLARYEWSRLSCPQIWSRPKSLVAMALPS